MGCGASAAPKSAPSVAASPVQALCNRPGCSQPTFDGKPGFCSRSCKQLAENPGGNVCLTLGCNKPTWNGQANEYCSRFCRSNNSGTNSLVRSDDDGTGHDDPPLVSQCTQLLPGDPRYDSVHKQYNDKWDRSRCEPTPIRAIYEVHQNKDLFNAFDDECHRIGNVPVFGFGKNPGNVQRRFHGTRIVCDFDGTCCSDTGCSVCQIVQNGFDMGRLGTWSGNKGHYGGGIYFTSMSSTAKGYGLNKDAGYSFHAGNWMQPAAGNAVFVSLIACGRVHQVDDKCFDPVDRSQYESRKIDKSTGVDELVVFDGKQTLLRYLIVF